MIEVGGLPCGCVVAILTGLRKPEPDVVGIGSLPKLRKVTTHAIGGRSFVLTAHMAGGAVETGMAPRQGEAGHFEMIEGGAEPRRDRVTLLATSRESRRRVTGCRGLLIRRRVTRVALERKPLKLTDGRSLVAAVALQRGMSSDQRKPVLVIAHCLNRNLPPFHVVAAFAIRAHLPMMNVGVAIPAPRAGIGENRFRVTLSARYVLVHTQKREAGFSVIKFRNSADGFPSENGVAILAGNVQVTVGTAGRDGAPRLRTG